MKKYLFLLFIILTINKTFSQEGWDIITFWNDKEDNGIVNISDINYEEVYRLWGNNQYIELIQIDLKEYSGRIINYIYSVDSLGKILKINSEEIKIPSKKVKKLIIKLKSKNIIELSGNESISLDDLKSYSFLDYIFEMNLNNKIQIFLHSPTYIKMHTKGTKKQQVAENLIPIIQRKLKSLKKYQNFINNLDSGLYKFGYGAFFEVE